MPDSVSVIIPYFNNDATILEAVESVLAQTVAPSEIFVIDDCSDPDRVGPLGRLPSGVTPLRTRRNGGAGAARNVGLAAASGTWVACLDADDVWLPTKLERQLAFLTDHPDYDGCQCGTIVWRDGVDAEQYIDKPLLVTEEMACQGGGANMLPSAAIFRRSMLERIGGWSEARPLLEDWDLTIRAVAAGARLGAFPEALVRFRRDGHEHQTSDPWTDLLVHLNVLYHHRRYMATTLGAVGLLAKRAKCLQRFGLRMGGVAGFLIARGAGRWMQERGNDARE